MFQRRRSTAAQNPAARNRPPQTLDQYVTIFASSQDLDNTVIVEGTNGTARHNWESEDPPPTILSVQLDMSKFALTSLQSSSFKVYLSRYFFDCVWRDSQTPDVAVTSNSGTSVSKKIFLTFYVGDISSKQRLLKPKRNITQTTDCDYVIARNSSLIGEQASNPYATYYTTDSNTYFENQFTSQADYFGEPGILIGDADMQGLRTLKDTRTLTIQMTTERTDQYNSPFWWKAFLTGSSLWDPLLNVYKVVTPPDSHTKYYSKLSSLTITQKGGPYMPLTLYTLDNPVNQTIAPFVTTSTLTDVSDPIEGEYDILNHYTVKMRLTQHGITNSVDLSEMNVSSMSGTAMSDQTSYSVRCYDVSTQSVVTKTVLDGTSSTLPTFPKGAWPGFAVTDYCAGLHRMTTFPWEGQSIMSKGISDVYHDKVSYNSGTHSSLILLTRNYLYMDPGSSWNGVNGDTTVGERSLQFDFGEGRAAFVNKFQILFPKSQEGTQPYQVSAGIMRQWEENLYKYTDTPSSVWFSGYQSTRPCGDKNNPDISKGYRYLTTHTQASNNLYGSYQNMVAPWPNFIIPGESSFAEPRDFSWSGGQHQYNNPTLAGTPKRPRQVLPGGPKTWYSKDPNTLNPAQDMIRQEYGPFVRGADYRDLEDVFLVKAFNPFSVTRVGGYGGENIYADWSSAFTSGYYFQSFVAFMLSSAGEAAIGNVLGYGAPLRLFVYNQSLVSATRVMASNNNTSGIYQGTTEYIWLYDTAPDDVPSGDLSTYSPHGGSYTILATTQPHVLFLNRVDMWIMNCADPYNPVSTDPVFKDYVVKETYYFAPQYDQYTSSRTTLFDGAPILRPAPTSVSQKMVIPDYATSRYFGMAFGSKLSPSYPFATRCPYNSGHNELRIYAVRLYTQLYDFTTNTGEVLDDKSTKTARFDSTFQCGLHQSCAVTDPGQSYTKDVYYSRDSEVMQAPTAGSKGTDLYQVNDTPPSRI